MLWNGVLPLAHRQCEVNIFIGCIYFVKYNYYWANNAAERKTSFPQLQATCILANTNQATAEINLPQQVGRIGLYR